MAKNTNDESAEPTVTINRKKLVTAGWIAGGVLALGATFAAGAAVGHVAEGPRGGEHAAVGHTGMTEEHGPKGMHGEHRGHGPMGERGAHEGMGHGPKNQLGELKYEGEVSAPTDGTTVDGIVPSPSTTP
jgi:hypothetical protein